MLQRAMSVKEAGANCVLRCCIFHVVYMKTSHWQCEDLLFLISLYQIVDSCELTFEKLQTFYWILSIKLSNLNAALERWRNIFPNRKISSPNIFRKKRERNDTYAGCQVEAFLQFLLSRHNSKIVLFSIQFQRHTVQHVLVIKVRKKKFLELI